MLIESSESPSQNKSTKALDSLICPAETVWAVAVDWYCLQTRTTPSCKANCISMLLYGHAWTVFPPLQSLLDRDSKITICAQCWKKIWHASVHCPLWTFLKRPSRCFGLHQFRKRIEGKFRRDPYKQGWTSTSRTSKGGVCRCLFANSFCKHIYSAHSTSIPITTAVIHTDHV